VQYLKKIATYIRRTFLRLVQKTNRAMQIVFVKEKVRKAVYFAAIAGLILLMYLIAIFDMGLWINDLSITGILAGYVLQGRFYPLHTFLIVASILLLLLLYYLFKKAREKGNTERGFEISESNVYGSARDINEDEIKMVADICPKESAVGTILGQLDETEQRLITSKPIANFNNNLLVLAPPGSGKTFCIVQNSICQAIRRGESVVTTDTKGELWAKTVEYARGHGYIVRRLDLKNPRFSDGFDILGEMRNDDIRTKIAASIIMRNTGNEKDIHASAEEALLAAICMYQDLNDAIPPEEKTLYNAFSMLFNGATSLDTIFNSIKHDRKLRVAYDSYATFLQGSPNLRGNVITGLANRLNILSSPAIRDMTSTPDIDLTLPGRKKCIYYCEMPDQHDAMRFLATLFFSFLLWDLTDYADAQMDQRLPVPVNVMLEEAYACGELPTITNALSTVRSRGISITLIAQGLSQFHILYGEEVTNTILNSCATFACLGTNTADTAELFSWMSGDATVKVKTEQHTVGEGPLRFGRNYSTGEGRQALYTGNDLRKIPFGRIFIVWQRFNPIMAYTFGINRHPEYIKGKMPKILANTKIPLSDKAAKDFIRQKEEERVQQYEDWLRDGGDPWADYGVPKPHYNGPSRKKPAPEFIPYPDLEDMALEFSASKKTNRDRSKLMKELQRQPKIPPEEGFEPIFVPADFTWETMSLENDEDAESPDIPDKEFNSLTTPVIDGETEPEESYEAREPEMNNSEIPEATESNTPEKTQDMTPVAPEDLLPLGKPCTASEGQNASEDKQEGKPPVKAPGRRTQRVQSEEQKRKTTHKQTQPRRDTPVSESLLSNKFGLPGNRNPGSLFQINHTLTKPIQAQKETEEEDE